MDGNGMKFKKLFIGTQRTIESQDQQKKAKKSQPIGPFLVGVRPSSPTSCLGGIAHVLSHDISGRFKVATGQTLWAKHKGQQEVSVKSGGPIHVGVPFTRLMMWLMMAYDGLRGGINVFQTTQAYNPRHIPNKESVPKCVNSCSWYELLA